MSRPSNKHRQEKETISSQKTSKERELDRRIERLEIERLKKDRLKTIEEVATLKWKGEIEIIDKARQRRLQKYLITHRDLAHFPKHQIEKILQQLFVRAIKHQKTCLKSLNRRVIKISHRKRQEKQSLQQARRRLSIITKDLIRAELQLIQKNSVP